MPDGKTQAGNLGGLMSDRLPSGGVKQKNIDYGYAGEKESVTESGPVLKISKTDGKSGSVTTKGILNVQSTNSSPHSPES